MYLKQQKRSNGNINLSIMEKYYVPKIGASEKTIESLGYISELNFLQVNILFRERIRIKFQKSIDKCPKIGGYALR